MIHKLREVFFKINSRLVFLANCVYRYLKSSGLRVGKGSLLELTSGQTIQPFKALVAIVDPIIPLVF
jgi:hypothetical protein